MRVYLPATLEEINGLMLGKTVPGRTGYALLPQWAQQQPETDQEVLEGQLLYLASVQSQKDGRRIVLVVEAPATEVDASKALVEVGQISQKQVLAMFADDRINTVAISQGADISELDLTWFGPTEILEFWDFLNS